MKIAVSAVGINKGDLLDKRFGRCSYFQIHDIENGEMNYVENKGQSASGGAGIAAAQQIIDEKVDVVITGNLGPNAYELFESAGIKAFKANNISVEAVLNEYKEGKLAEINTAGPAHHGMA